MMDKQKVVEAIQGWMLDDGGSEYDLCNRIAPLMRGEFPEEGFNSILQEYGMEARCGQLMALWLEKFKRLWDGEEAPSTNDLEGGLRVLATAPSDTAHVHFPPVVDTTPKGTCQKCGGSGYYPAVAEYPPAPAQKCQYCGGTGECQHKNATRHEKPMPLPFCLDCAHYFDPRSGEERRVGKDKHRSTLV